MYTKLPDAVATVCFDGGITGEQLCALVQKVTGQDGYVEERRYFDGDVINFGQRSGYPYKHVRVVPTLDSLPYFRFEELYFRAIVMSTSWGGSVFLVDYDQDSVVFAVKQFAAKLSDAYKAALLEGSFPNYEPQNSDDEYEW